MKVYGRYRFIALANIILLVAILSHSIYRDVQLEKHYTGDLRNRVVGARLQKDGLPPYFYRWKRGDGYRYLDPASGNSGKAAGFTASPVFHDLLIPICELPQRTISLLWFWLQWFMLVIITVLLARLCQNGLQQWVLINFSVLFTCTEAWKYLIQTGQMYFCMAFLFTLIIYGLLKRDKKRYLLMAALSTALLILVKPTAVVILLPFLLQYKLYYKYLIAAFVFILAYGMFAMINNNERSYWLSYKDAMGEHLKRHQHLHPTLVSSEKPPVMAKLEGIDFDKIYQDPDLYAIEIHSENGNFFVVFQQLFHKKMPVLYLVVIFGFIVILSMSVFVLKKLNIAQYVLNTTLLALLLFMLSEIFGPIHRNQYNTVQWLPILLAGLLMLKSWKDPAALLFVLGLLLNISNTTLIPLRHTLGEFCWIVALVIIIYKKVPGYYKNAMLATGQ